MHIPPPEAGDKQILNAASGWEMHGPAGGGDTRKTQPSANDTQYPRRGVNGRTGNIVLGARKGKVARMENEVLELIEMLYTMVSEAWGVPLGNDKCIIERDKALNLLDELKAQLPAELAEAKRLVSARDEFVSNAKREAESIRKVAEEQARRLVEEQEIVRIAKARSSELLSTAENKSRELRRVANEYVDDALRRTEEAVSAALDEIRQSRIRFRSAVGSRAAQQPVQTISDEEFAEDSR